jgi:hypothetical protein
VVVLQKTNTIDGAAPTASALAVLAHAPACRLVLTVPAAMAAATGLLELYCRAIRSGAQILHPRHWEALRALLSKAQARSHALDDRCIDPGVDNRLQCATCFAGRP